MQIIQPAKLGEFAALLFGKAAGARYMAQLEQSMVVAVQRSFDKDRHPVRQMTKAEIDRRGEILMSWARRLLDSGDWTVVKICDFMDTILNDELNGTRWEPPKITFWRPT